MKNTNHEDPKSIRDILQDFKEGPSMQKGFKKLEIAQEWEHIVGPYVAKMTQKINLQNQVLQVTLKSALLREEMRYGEAKIIDDLNQRLGDQTITKIRWY